MPISGATPTFHGRASWARHAGAPGLVLPSRSTRLQSGWGPALFVVEVPAAETEDSWGSTPGDLNMMVKQFSAAGKYLGVVMKNGTTARLYGHGGPISAMPDLPALAIRRPRSGAGEPKFGTVSMHTSFRDEIMGVAFQIKQKLTASKADALKAVATGAGATMAEGSQRWNGITAALPMPKT